MNQRLIMSFLGVICVMFVLIGCSGGSSPVMPPTELPKSTPLGSIDSLPIIGATMSDEMFHALGLLGAYELKIDSTNITAELVSKRTPSLGQSWIVSGIGFFTIAPCSNCLQVQSIALTADGNLQLKFAINHPFKPGNPTLPPTAVNRLDLDVFDVALVVAPIGATPQSFTLTGTSIYAGFMTKNAGYTTELARVTGDQAALPYALVVDDSLGSTKSWNEFSMGAIKTFDVFFDLGMSTFVFDMYLTMGYGASAQGKAQRLTPTYFNPEFNRKAAWKVEVTPPQGSNPPAMGNTWDDNDTTTPYNVTVKVWDWQHGVTTIANPPVNSGDIALASNVTEVSVDIPGMNSALPQATTATSGTGAYNDPLVFEVPVANQNGLGAGEYLGLVKVSDSRTPEATPVAIDFLIDSPNGITLTNYPIPEFATYQTFAATVVVGCGPLIGSITNPSVDPLTGVADGASLSFTASASSANGEPIVLYEWDMNYNGTTFNPHANTGATVTLGPFINPNCPTPTPVNYTVACRATDSCVPANVEIIDTTVITVDVCPVAPTCVIITNPSPPTNIPQGDPVALDGSSSSCPQPITTYDWDFDYDGVTFNVDDTGVTTNYLNCTPGTKTVALRVTSNVPLSSICTVQITIVADNGPIDGWHTDVSISPSRTLFPGSSGMKQLRSDGAKLYYVGYAPVIPYYNWFTKSEDRGQTWSTAIQINTTIPQSNSTTAATRPAIEIDHNTGDLYVSFHSNNSTTSTVLPDVWILRSQDDGVTWATPAQVNTDPSNLMHDCYPSIDIDDSVNPARLYMAWQNQATAGGYQIYVGYTTTANWTTWTQTQINETTGSSMQPCVQVNPVDKSVNVVWTNPRGYSGGNGEIFFDRSTNGGVTWGTDVLAYQFALTTYSYNVGPFEPSMAFNASGIPGVILREWGMNTASPYGGFLPHKFIKATSTTGATWNAAITLNNWPYSASGCYTYAGALECLGTHWVAVSSNWGPTSTSFNQYFYQSQDDGVTWSTPVKIDDATIGRANGSLVFDDCRHVHVIWASSTNYSMYDWGT